MQYYLMRLSPPSPGVMFRPVIIECLVPNERVYIQQLLVLHLRNPKPDSLVDVSWVLLGPLAILCIQCSLAGGDIGISRVDEGGSFEELPERIQQEENRNADVRSQEFYVGSAFKA